MVMLRLGAAMVLVLVAGGYHGAHAPARAVERQCAHATVMCARKLGYNYQECGHLSGDRGRTAIEYATCYDWDEGDCAPCVFGSVADTAAVCRRVFGTTCSYYFLQDHRWEEVDLDKIESEIESWDWPDLSPLWDWLTDPGAEGPAGAGEADP